MVYYNEIDPFCAQWLRNLIGAGHLPPGDVDERDIRDVSADDVRGYDQCHWFAGIGGFAYASRLAGWPDDRPIWTGGFPCQPFSVAGNQLAEQDDRHLWPELHRLIAQARPPVFLGENVAGIVPLALDGVLFDLEGAGYACQSFIVPACAVNAPHRRDRVWIMANTSGDGCEQGKQATSTPRHGGQSAAAGGPAVANSYSNAIRKQSIRELGCSRSPRHFAPGAWDGALWISCADGKRRRVGAGVRVLADGVSERVAKLRALGNAIVPQIAAEIIAAQMHAGARQP